jgi:hypothetical protein
LILSACMVSSRPGGGVEIVPFLPAIVEVDLDGYYAHSGHHYYHSNGLWYYSTTKGGARKELPRSHWPQETKRRDGRRDSDRGR